MNELLNRRGLAATLLIAGALLIAACGSSSPRLDPVASDDLATGASGAGTLTTSESINPPSAQAIEHRADKGAKAVADEFAAKDGRGRRLPRDVARDESRKGGAVLSFFRIEPGMTVLDMFAGGGYYTELLSRRVGPAGRVVAHNNTPYREFASDELAERYGDGRLTNVERLLAENNQLQLEPATFDAVLMVLSYHDVYFEDTEIGWTRIDAPAMLNEIYSAMKPGAVLGVIDHVAAPGSPPATGGSLHRIDPNLLKRDFIAAGFRLDSESNLLRNSDDDLSVSVFDPRVRGRTDRVLLRFRKP